MLSSYKHALVSQVLNKIMILKNNHISLALVSPLSIVLSPYFSFKFVEVFSQLCLHFPTASDSSVPDDLAFISSPPRRPMTL